MYLPHCLYTVALSLFLASCATGLKTTEANPEPMLAFQNKALNPANGGLLINGAQLQPGDIVLTADNGIKSSGIRLITLSPVSHAAVYMADQQVAEAVGEGIRRRSVTDLLAEETTIVVFRHPRLISPVDLLHMREGDVPSVKIRQTLQYAGHLKAPPQIVALN